MIHTDSDEGPVPVEVLQFEAAKANEADLAAARERAEEAEREVQRLREALEWADAMIWPRIKMLERHNGDKPSEESEALRRILGPIRRAHKHGEAAKGTLHAETD